MWTARTVKQATCALIVLLLAGTLAACSGGGANDASSRAGQPAPLRAEGGTTRDSTGDRTPGGGSGTGASAGDPKNRQAAQQPLPSGRSVVYTADLRVRVKNTDQAAAGAKQMAVSAGGYVENESSATAPAGATLSLKIPADRFDGVLDGLTTRLGKKLSLRRQAEDVTREVADVDSRVRSAEAALVSFRKLLDRANTVGEVINVEEEIARRQSELEALQARQKALQHSTRYATVSITLEEPAVATETPEREGGFIGGLKNGWHDFTAFMSGLAEAVGWLLPFLVTAAAIGWPALIVWRRTKDRRAAQGPRPAPAPHAPDTPAPVPASVAAEPSEAAEPEPDARKPSE
ncbi:DUF4349 domain-containing protein [Actinomadura vinacea]|uniref:DUF4349 domain-containing protein n=1 Tax=Actinomadura vinacea TaxID=115336 RepID=A0ABN3IYF1_9ACTN